ncbi:MAG: hypothetical protein QF599_12480, partial [Planctomycetota bacterium]|nr:hypothetical protein [Planctomycetota bacterium]
VCPVGALTLKDFRFQARVWNLRKSASTCPECSRGCSVTVEVLRDGPVKRIRPRHNEAVNGYWMCDEGRLGFHEREQRPRLAAALLAGASGLETASASRVIEVCADLISAAERPLLLASPFITDEEAELLKQLSASCGARAAVVIRDTESADADTILRTGDPSPNRRGLTEAGLEALSPAAAAAALGEADCALLLGERSAELVGFEALCALPVKLRLVLLDSYAPEGEIPALNACLGIPDWTERPGTWTNIDGHKGQLLPARPAPNGTRPLTATLRVLASILAESGTPTAADIAEEATR